MNRYFLMIALLQMWPEIAPVSPLTTFVPLLIIFAISAIKEGLDDYARYLTDVRDNSRIVTVVRHGSPTQVCLSLLAVLSQGRQQVELQLSFSRVVGPFTFICCFSFC